MSTAAPVRGRAKAVTQATPELQKSLQFLQTHALVSGIHTAGFEMHKHHLRIGTLRYVGDLPNGIRVKGYDENGTRLLLVNCRNDDRIALTQSIEGYNKAMTDLARGAKEEETVVPHRALPAHEPTPEEREQWRQQMAARRAGPLFDKPFQTAFTQPVTPVAPQETAMPVAKSTTPAAALSVKDAAQLLGVSTSSIYVWINAKRLKYIPLPPGAANGVTVPRFFDRAQIEAFKVERETKPGRGGGRPSNASKGEPLAETTRGHHARKSKVPKIDADAEWITTLQAAKLAGVTDQSVRNWVASERVEKLPGTSVILVKRADVDAIIRARNPVAPVAPPAAVTAVTGLDNQIFTMLAEAMQGLRSEIVSMRADIGNNTKEIKALREMLPAFLELGHMAENANAAEHKH